MTMGSSGKHGASLGPNREAYAAGRYTFEFDDRKPVGFVSSIEGGAFKAEAMTEAIGSALSPTRFPGKPKFDDVTVQVGATMAPAFYNWLQATLDFKPERKSGALVGYDNNSLERSRRTFYDGLITEIGFPALDGKGGGPLNVTVKIAPERLEYEKGDRSKLIYKTAKDELQNQRKWVSSNFKFELERFKGDKRIVNSKVDAFSVKQNVISNPVGNRLEPLREIGRIEMPTMSVTVPEPQAIHWMEWWNESVRKNNYMKSTTSGALTYMANDGSELMRVELFGVGLTGLDTTRFEPGKSEIATVRASLFVDRIKIVPGAGNS